MKWLRSALTKCNTRIQVRGASLSAIQNDDSQKICDAVPYEEIPGPKPIPFFGNSWRFLPYIGDFSIEQIDQVSKTLHNKYGDIVKISGLMGRPDMVFLYDPDDIQRVFREEDAMPLRPSMPSLNYFKHVHKKDFFGDNAGVIAVHGENWYNFRTKVQQVLLQPRVAKQYLKPIEDTCAAFINRIEVIKDDSNEVPGDFLNEVHKWSLESIARVALDVRLGCFDDVKNSETQKLIDAVNTFFINVPILELKIPVWRLFKTPTFIKYIEALDVIHEIVLKHVNVAMANINENNLMEEPSVLQRVLAMDNDIKTASVLALDLFLVGIDTTSNAVASILYQLALHPEKQDILYTEICNTIGNDSENINDKIDRMTYLRSCIKETLRMYPVVIGNGRCTSQDYVIQGYRIPKGVQFVFQHLVASNLDKYFTRSQEFLPERWLKPCPVHEEKNQHPFASLPFGYGRRMCLGKRFADLEMQMVIAKVIQKYKIEYHHEKLSYHIHPMYTPNGPLKLRFIERN